jgi:hypothetical protein
VRQGLAAFDTAGALLPWDPMHNQGGVVTSIAKAANTIYASGVFFPGGVAHAFGAFDTVGNLLPWNPQADLPAATMLFDSDRMYLVGSFSALNASVRSRYAVVDAHGAGEILQ